jgi:hypothetical protein
VDSLMLVEEGYEVVSIDASDKMLKYALKERWNRRREPNFDRWSKLIYAIFRRKKTARCRNNEIFLKRLLLSCY